MTWRDYLDLDVVEADLLSEALGEMISRSNSESEIVSQPRDYRR